MDELLSILEQGRPWLKWRVVGEAKGAGGRTWPLLVITMGPEDRRCPAVGYFGGVHGLERIGAVVVVSFLRSLVQRLAWDELLRQQVGQVRMVFMPLVNPEGLMAGTRSNGQGIDLMRNSPVEAKEGIPWLLGGHRLSPYLPWFRGAADAPMQSESRALCEVVEEELLTRPLAISIDCHSGFGLSDRIWFPYAFTRQPIEHLPEMMALTMIFDATQMYHRYVLEPQSLQYLTHGDLWDHLYQRSLARGETLFLPLTLEMGSWLWVKKNPRQLFTRHGIFNPLIQHRQHRVIRRHLGCLDFFSRAAISHRHWLPDAARRHALREQAFQRWYRRAE